VTMPSNSLKAEREIARMPIGAWMDVRAISKGAQLSTSAMAKFLLRARGKGIVERKIIVHGFSKLRLWRRIV